MYEWAQDAANTIQFVMVDASNEEVAGLEDTFALALAKPGGAFVVGSGVKAEVGNGWYRYIATPAEADTAGTVAIKVTAAGCQQQNLLARVGAVDAHLVAIQAKTDLITTGTAINVVSPLDGSDLAIIRGDTLVVLFSDLGALTGRAQLWFTLKRAVHEADAVALLQIEETAGLLYALGAVAPNATLGSLLVTDAATGTTRLTVDETVTAQLTGRGLVWDIQLRTTDEVVRTLARGAAAVTADVTRRTT